MILNLYSSILIPVVSEWLCPSDVCTLDVAVCNHACREGFLMLLSKCILCNENDGSCDSLFEWLDIRNLRLNGLYAFGSLSPNAIRVLSRTKHLKWVCAIPDGLAPVLELCPSISSLNLLMDVTEQNFMPLLPKLRSLTKLDLNYCKITEAIKFGIVKSCPNLTSFSSTGDDADVIYGCEGLTEVSCLFKEDTADAVCERSLTSLHLRIPYFSSVSDDDILDIVEHNLQLHSLTISGGHFKDELMCYVAKNCLNVTQLNFLSNCTTTDVGLETVAAHCRALKGFSVSSNNITDKGIAVLISGCPLLTSLTLMDCDCLTDDAIKNVLLNCSKLERLEAYSTLFTDAAFSGAYAACPTLSLLNLETDDPEMPGKLTSELLVSNAIDLEEISLTSYWFKLYKKYKAASSLLEIKAVVEVELPAMLSLLMQSPRLIRIQLDAMDVDKSFFKEMSQCCPMLADISVRECESISSSCIVYLLRVCTNLKKLKFQLSDPDDETLEDIDRDVGQNVSSLTHLIVLSMIPKNFLDKVALICPSLKSIVLSRTNVTSAYIEKLLRECNLLSDINLSDCSSVDGSVFHAIADLRRKMNCVDVSGCDLITKSDVMNFVSIMGGLLAKLKV